MVRRQTMYLLLLAQFNEPFANQVRWMKYAVCVNSGCHVSSPYCARLFNSSKNKLMLSFRSANLGKYEYSLKGGVKHSNNHSPNIITYHLQYISPLYDGRNATVIL